MFPQQQINMQQYRNWRKRSFLCGPRRSYIANTNGKSNTWELAADAYLLKLQRLQNKVLRITEKFPRCTSVRDLNMAFNLPYVYGYIRTLYWQQAKSYKIMRVNVFAA
jgi:hypothetical protein